MASRVATLYITKSISLEELTGSTTIIIDSHDSTRKPLYIRKRSRAHGYALYINVNDHVHVVKRRVINDVRKLTTALYGQHKIYCSGSVV